MRGIGKGSLGQCLLRSVWSTHILHSPFSIFTRTGFASQSGCATSLMKSAERSRVTSTLIASFRSCAKRQSRCLTGFAVLSRSKECSASSLGTPGMSDGFHAKMSQFSWRKEVSAPSYAESRLASISAVLCVHRPEERRSWSPRPERVVIRKSTPWWG